MINHDESDVQWQITIYGSHLSVFWDMFMKREGNFKMCILWLLWESLQVTICVMYDIN